VLADCALSGLVFGFYIAVTCHRATPCAGGLRPFRAGCFCRFRFYGHWSPGLHPVVVDCALSGLGVICFYPVL